jgi:hypothetical protein
VLYFSSLYIRRPDREVYCDPFLGRLDETAATPAKWAETAPAGIGGMLNDGGGSGKFSLRRLLAETGGSPTKTPSTPGSHKSERGRAASASGTGLVSSEL